MASGALPPSETVDILVTIDDREVQGGDKGLFSRAAAPVIQTIPVTQLRASFRASLAGLKEIFSDLPGMSPDLPLQQVQLTFEVTTTGKVALLGSSAELAGKGAITLTFARPPANGK